jgi:hypothetical protein
MREHGVAVVELRAGFKLRQPPRKGSGPPRHHPYDATIDGAVISGFHFKTKEEARAFAERIIANEKKSKAAFK